MRDSRLPSMFLALLLVFVLGPFLVILVASFGAEPSLRFPPQGFSLAWFENALSQRMFVRGFAVSVRVAIASTALALLLGVPLAYALSRYAFPGRGVLQAIATLPIIVPELVVGLALLQYLILTTGIAIVPSLIVGHTALLIPYAVRVVLASLDNVPVDIEQAAVNLGASRVRTFFAIVLPNVRDGILTTSILAFILSFNNVPVSLFLTGPGVATLPIQMLLFMEYNFDPSIAALSTLLIGFSILVVFAIERLLGLSRTFG